MINLLYYLCQIPYQTDISFIYFSMAYLSTFNLVLGNNSKQISYLIITHISKNNKLLYLSTYIMCNIR